MDSQTHRLKKTQKNEIAAVYGESITLKDVLSYDNLVGFVIRSTKASPFERRIWPVPALALSCAIVDKAGSGYYDETS